MKNFKVIKVSFIIFLGIILLYSCQDGVDLRIDKENNDITRVMSLDQKKVIDFLSICESSTYNNRSLDQIDYYEAEQLCDMSTNYSHGRPDIYCSEYTYDTMYFQLPAIDDNGNINLGDLAFVYNNIISETNALVSNCTDGMDVLRYFIVDFPSIRSRNEDITVTISRGVKKDMPPIIVITGPFEEGDDWIWGNDNGKCDMSVLEGDAAQELSKYFEYIPPTPPTPNHRLWVHSIVEKKYNYDEYVYPNNTTWLFYMENPDGINDLHCIPWYKLNIYWNRINDKVVKGELSTFEGGRKYYSCEVQGLFDETDADASAPIRHNLKVKYAVFDWAILDDPIPPVN